MTHLYFGSFHFFSCTLLFLFDSFFFISKFWIRYFCLQVTIWLTYLNLFFFHLTLWWLTIEFRLFLNWSILILCCKLPHQGHLQVKFDCFCKVYFIQCSMGMKKLKRLWQAGILCGCWARDATGYHTSYQLNLKWLE